MTLNESNVEDAALSRFGEFGFAIGHGPHIAPGQPAAERDSFGEVVLMGGLRHSLLLKLLIGGLSVTSLESRIETPT